VPEFFGHYSSMFNVANLAELWLQLFRVFKKSIGFSCNRRHTATWLNRHCRSIHVLMRLVFKCISHHHKWWSCSNNGALTIVFTCCVSVQFRSIHLGNVSSLSSGRRHWDTRLRVRKSNYSGMTYIFIFCHAAPGRIGIHVSGEQPDKLYLEATRLM